eukprot:1794021-Prymnesium_polylepis.1
MANGLAGSSLTTKRAPSTSESGTGMAFAFVALAARWSGQPPTKCEIPSRVRRWSPGAAACSSASLE